MCFCSAGQPQIVEIRGKILKNLQKTSGSLADTEILWSFLLINRPIAHYLTCANFSKASRYHWNLLLQVLCRTTPFAIFSPVPSTSRSYLLCSPCFSLLLLHFILSSTVSKWSRLLSEVSACFMWSVLIAVFSMLEIKLWVKYSGGISE